MINVLMTGAGSPGGPGIIKCLTQDSNINLIVADANEHSSGRYLSKNFIKIPKADNDNFIDFMLDVAQKRKIDIIFPLVTKELFKFSENIKQFNDVGTKIIVSNLDDLKIANNKTALYIHLYDRGIEVPKFFPAKNLLELRQGISYIGYPNSPFCVKPSISNGSRGVRIVNEQIDEFNLLFDEKPNGLFTTHDQLISTLSHRPFPELLVSEYLPGEEYTVDTIVHNSVPILIIPRKRVKTNGGISVQGVFEKNSEIIKYCTDILKTLNLDGPIGLQVKQDVNGKFKLLEINPRIQGTSVSALGLGINLPLIAVNNKLGIKTNLEKNIKWGTNFIRYYNELYF